MLVYLYACILVCLYVCMLVCLYACMFVCLYACMLVCLYACMLVCLYPCMLVCSATIGDYVILDQSPTTIENMMYGGVERHNWFYSEPLL